MARSKPLVAETRKYLVTTVAQAKEITTGWLQEIELRQVVSLGLPEIDDRYHIWRVPLCKEGAGAKIGEVVIDAYTTAILYEKTTRPDMLEARLLRKDEARIARKPRNQTVYPMSTLRNTIGMGDSVDLLDEMPRRVR